MIQKLKLLGLIFITFTFPFVYADEQCLDVPDSPRISSTTHVAYGWNSNPDVQFDIETRPGCAHTHYAWNQELLYTATENDTMTSEYIFTLSAASSGAWYFHAISSNDEHVQNREGTLHLGPYRIDITQPEVSILSPLIGKLYAHDSMVGSDLLGQTRIVGDITFEIFSHDVHSGMRKIEIWIDGKKAALFNPNSNNTYSWKWTAVDQIFNYGIGRHFIEIRSTDNVGNVGYSSMWVVVGVGI